MSVGIDDPHGCAQWIFTAHKLDLRAIITVCVSVGIDDPHGCANSIKKLFWAQYLFCAPLWGSSIPTDALTSKKFNFSHQVRLWRVRGSLQSFSKCELRFRVRDNPNHTCCVFVGIDDPHGWATEIPTAKEVMDCLLALLVAVDQ